MESVMTNKLLFSSSYFNSIYYFNIRLKNSLNNRKLILFFRLFSFVESQKKSGKFLNEQPEIKVLNYNF